MTSPLLTVVIGTHNRLDALRRCVDSIFRETRTPFVIRVTDAGSTDGTIEYLQSIACDTIRPVLVGRRIGQAKAYNAEFRQVSTRFVAWLSDDNEVVNNGLDVAVAVLRKRPTFGMVGLKVKDVQGPFVNAPYIGGISEIGVLNVNQGVLPTRVLRKIGCFSETFGFYGIDPDLTARVLYSGYDIVYTRTIALHHYRDWAEDKASPEYAALKLNQQRSLELYNRKYGGLGKDDRAWSVKKAVWVRIRGKLGDRYDVNSPRPRLGGVYRDWNNGFSARHIRPYDTWLHLSRPYHLRQHVSRRKLPAALPPDPVIESDQDGAANGAPE